MSRGKKKIPPTASPNSMSYQPRNMGVHELRTGKCV